MRFSRVSLGALLALVSSATAVASADAAAAACPSDEYQYCITNFTITTAPPGQTASTSFHLVSSQSDLPDHPVNCKGSGPANTEGIYQESINCAPRPNGYVVFSGNQTVGYDLFLQFEYKQQPIQSYSDNTLPKKRFQKGSDGLVRYVGPKAFRLPYTVTH